MVPGPTVTVSVRASVLYTGRSNLRARMCFPMIKDATDYHWAIFSGTHWLEQAGRGGPLNIWANEDDLIADVYKRGSYVEGSHFFFMMPIDMAAGQ